MKNIAVAVGSLSPHSVNKKLVRTLEALAEGKLRFHYLDIAALPHYDNDLWANPPRAVVELKETIEAADGVLIATPEYNRSFPGVIKNALDWASRPYGQSSWMHKPAALTGASPGTIGTAAAQGQLRSILPLYGLILMGQPELYFYMKPGIITDELEITDETTQAFLKSWVEKFTAWVERHGEVHVPAIAAE
jgi:chromate reductase